MCSQLGIHTVICPYKDGPIVKPYSIQSNPGMEMCLMSGSASSAIYGPPNVYSDRPIGMLICLLCTIRKIVLFICKTGFCFSLV